jgi:predicted transcriptional regulator
MLRTYDLRQKFEDAGIRIEDIELQPQLFNRMPDFLARADVDGRKINLLIEVKERPHLVDLRLVAEAIKRYAGPNQIPVITSHFIGPNRRALLKEMGVGYIDMAGNIYLRAPGIFIEREEKLNPFGYEREGLNPYSDKASIILRILVNEPKRSWKIREIANFGNINPGWVSRVVDSLVERGLIEFTHKQGIVLLRGEDALKEWADIYDWRRNKFYYYYCHALDFQEVLKKISKPNLASNRMIALGFQAGAYLVSPYSTFNQVHLLIDGRSFDVIRPEIEQQLELESRREGANLILVRPYYKHSALFGARKIKNWWVVSDIQLYLDLNRYPLRGQEQAEHLLDKVIRPRFRKVMGDMSGNKR